ncbi:MAG: D-alanine--D-alanine ligase [Patescibacteria group bacterium]
MNSKINVAVLLGGVSSERNISLISGAKVVENIPVNKYDVTKYDLKDQLTEFINDVTNKKIDVVFPVLHGKFGEDGTVQGLLELLQIPYVGCNVLTSSLCMDKAITKKMVAYHNILTPEFNVFSNFEEININQITLPCVVKPTDAGSSVGTSIPETKQELISGIKNAFSESQQIIIEEYIKGREFTVGIIGNRNQTVFPITEIKANISKFYDYKAKYENGGSTHICPAQIDSKLAEQLKSLSKKIFNIVGARGVSRIDFMVSEDNTPYFIEVNTMPGMTGTSLLPEMASKINISFAQLLDKLIQLAFEK